MAGASYTGEARTRTLVVVDLEAEFSAYRNQYVHVDLEGTSRVCNKFEEVNGLLEEFLQQISRYELLKHWVIIAGRQNKQIAPLTYATLASVTKRVIRDLLNSRMCSREDIGDQDSMTLHQTVKCPSAFDQS